MGLRPGMWYGDGAAGAVLIPRSFTNASSFGGDTREVPPYYGYMGTDRTTANEIRERMAYGDDLSVGQYDIQFANGSKINVVDTTADRVVFASWSEDEVAEFVAARAR